MRTCKKCSIAITTQDHLDYEHEICDTCMIEEWEREQKEQIKEWESDRL